MLVRVDDVMRRALAPVLRDIETTSAPMPIIADSDWAGSGYSSASLWSPNGRTGCGIQVDPESAEWVRVAWVTEQLQEWLIEELWPKAPTNWPRCPQHPQNHPLCPAVVDERAVWLCPSDRALIAPIGAVPAPGA
jgi:hypothetical protein